MSAPAGLEPGADPLGQTRKTVTVLFCDVTGSTALGERLDPESFRAVLARYYAAIRQLVERHGGSVEKFIGDAVMAVFGVPAVHEDDALRAVRSAWQMSENLPSLNEELERDFGTQLELRIGLDTGEVVTGTEERLATGDIVNTAARLQQAASPGEILMGERTLQMTHNAVEVVPTLPLTVRGKSLPVAAFRLVGMRAPTDLTGRLEAPLVGRAGELRKLRDTLRGVTRTRACRVFTLVGAAGAGKSRLIRAVLSGAGATIVLQGRCLSYGEGATYWPLVEAVTPLLPRLPGVDLDPAARTTIEDLLGGGAVSGDEIAWSFRKLLEALASMSPVIAVFDDIQWADEALLDLIEHLPLVSVDVPILMLCLARPDLLDRRPAWVADMRLDSLPAGDVEHLIDQCLGGTNISAAARERIRGSAAGNPLFVEEMTAMVQTSGGLEGPVPPTIQALLSARLDQLPVPERRLLSRAAVEGEVFHGGAIRALLPEEKSLTPILTALVRKELVVSHAPQLPGEDAFRFRHVLIRDAAYDSTPKALRAELHERFASWLEGKVSDRLVEGEAILGYHCEQAYRYRTSLGPVDDQVRQLGARAGKLLASAATRTLARGNARVAVALFERAQMLVPAGSVEGLEQLPRLGHALTRYGEHRRAVEVLDAAIESSRLVGNESVEWRARVERARILETTNPRESIGLLLREAQAAVSALERIADDEGLAIAWQGAAEAHNTAMQYEAMADALNRSLEYARRLGNDELITEAETWMAVVWTIGPTPSSEMWRLAHETKATDKATPRREQWRLIAAATAAALQGRSGDARELFGRSQALLEGGESMYEQLATFSYEAIAALNAGDAQTAERDARAAFEICDRTGASGLSATVAAHLSRALYELGRDEEAEHYAEISRRDSSLTDIFNEAQWRRAWAKILAGRDQAEEALTLASQAVAIMESTDALNEKADAEFDLADVLRLAGREEECAAPLVRALALYERKENLVRAAVVRDRLSSLKGMDRSPASSASGDP